jgi:hypothetical protein
MKPEINQPEFTSASQIYKVTTLSKYLALALFIILPFLGGWIGYTYALERVFEVEKVITEEVVIEVTSKEDKNYSSVNIKSYRDETLGLTFDYPSDWGEVTVNDEKGRCSQDYALDDCNFRTLIFKDISSQAIFLSAETKGHQDNPIGRGAFWGDVAGSITSDYLSSCEQRNNCSIVKNSNDVSFIVYEANPPPEEMGYQPERYYVHNPDNQYYGLVLSSHRINSQSPENNRMFKEIVIDSFKFF